MSQTANNLSAAQKHTTLTISTQPTKSVASQNQEGITKLTNWFGQVQFINGLQYTVLPAGKLHYKDRLVLKFALAADYTAHFVLLKSLFEFGKSSGILISSDRTDKTFAIEVLTEHTETAIAYFENIMNWLTREIKFKTALKQVITWEQKVRAEQQNVIDNLYVSLQ